MPPDDLERLLQTSVRQQKFVIEAAGRNYSSHLESLPPEKARNDLNRQVLLPEKNALRQQAEKLVLKDDTPIP